MKPRVENNLSACPQPIRVSTHVQLPDRTDIRFGRACNVLAGKSNVSAAGEVSMVGQAARAGAQAFSRAVAAAAASREASPQERSPRVSEGGATTNTSGSGARGQRSAGAAARELDTQAATRTLDVREAVLNGGPHPASSTEAGLRPAQADDAMTSEDEATQGHAPRPGQTQAHHTLHTSGMACRAVRE